MDSPIASASALALRSSGLSNAPGIQVAQIFSASLSSFEKLKYGTRNGLSMIMPPRSGPSCSEVSSSIVPVSGPGCSVENQRHRYPCHSRFPSAVLSSRVTLTSAQKLSRSMRQKFALGKSHTSRLIIRFVKEKPTIRLSIPLRRLRLR